MGKKREKAMKNCLNRAMALLLASALAMGSLVIVQGGSVQASESEYEIYPIPHEMTYAEDSFVIRQQVNVVYDSTIDEATKNRMNQVLALKNKEVTISGQEQDGMTNIFVGTYGSGEYADNYVEENYDIDEALFSEYGSHYLISDNGKICILGADTDAAFYGITSLKHIFKQMDGSEIRNFVMKDYADTNTRGFIEGYYGIPWSNEDRISLMKFGGEFKMTSYIFAPKNDPYHTSRWRELYPEDEIAQIAEMVQAGIESKCRFVWTAHPFMGGFNSNDVDGEIAALLNKYEQLYSVGVRQFGVLGDDVGNLDRQIVTRVMNAVSEWGKEKGDVYDPVFCPAGYNHSWQGDYSELNAYDAGFPEDVQIFWTGEAVCQPVSQETLDHFRRYRTEEGVSERRSPLFWLNWPVNDINGERLLMGKGSLLHTDIDPDDLKGVVTNPMQEAEASKVAIFAVADYSWNVKAFNADQSWADSFKYVDEDASEELHTLAKHMSNPQPNGHGLVLAESEELQPLITEFEGKLERGEPLAETGSQLIDEMDIIIQACDGFHANSKNEKLKQELLPFTGSLKDLASAIRSFIQAASALEEGNPAEAFEKYSAGSASYADSQNHERIMLNGSSFVSPGSTHLIPLAEKIQEAISDDVNDYVSGGSQLKITASSSFENFYSGKIENIIDQDDSTSAWYGGYEASGQYFQVNLSAPASIYGVHILNGANGGDKKQDTFGAAKLEYTSGDGTWKDVNGIIYEGYPSEVNVTDIELKNVTGVRYICTEPGEGNKWPAMREFRLDFDPGSSVPEFTSEVIRTTDGWRVYSGQEVNAVDGDDSTGVHYNVRQGDPDNGDSMVEGDYFGVKLSQPITLGKIHIVQGPSEGSSDYMKNAVLQYSENGSDWRDIQSYTNQSTIDIDLSDQNITAQYVRLYNRAKQHNWFGIREFEVASKIVHNGKVYTNAEVYREYPADYAEDHADIVPADPVVLEKDQYIGLKLDRIHELDSIESDVTGGDVKLQISENAFEWEEVDAGKLEKQNARYIRLINTGESAVTLNIRSFVVNTAEIYEKAIEESSYGNVTDPLNVFDGSWTTATAYSKSQTKGQYFIYDLGQEINLNSFKVVCTDSEWDFPRHAKFSVSADMQKWEEIMTLGSQDSANEGEAEGSDNINTVLPDHEISYNTKTVSDLDKRARYLKFEITRTKEGPDKWVRFQELEINGGEYIPEENNPTYTSDTEETRNGRFSYMRDNSLSTMFIPKEANKNLIYHLSDGNKENSVKIIQNSSAISEAQVAVRLLGSPDDWTVIGKLSQTINEFVLPQDSVILDVRLAWGDVIPNIIELSTGIKQKEDLDKSALNGVLENPEDTSLWTKNAKKAYDDAYAVAESLKENDYISQETINTAVKAVEEAAQNKVLKGDASKVQEAVDRAYTDETMYTASTWKAYQKTVNAAKNALKDPENLSEMIEEELLKNMKTAQEALVYNPSAKEEAQILSEDMRLFIDAVEEPEELYTSDSFTVLTEKYRSLTELLELNETEPQAPQVFRMASGEMKAAQEGLVKVYELPSLIREYEEKAENQDIYTEETWNAYEAACKNGQKALKSGTEESVKAAIQQITGKRAELEIELPEKDVLKQLIEEAKKLDGSNYTNASYQALRGTIEEIEDRLEEMSESEIKAAIEKLGAATDSLVSVQALKAQIHAAQSYYENDYVAESYAVLKKAVENAAALCENGTREQIADAINAIQAAINGLARKVDKDYAIATVTGIQLEDVTKYTEKSAQRYLDAYQVLKDMLKDLDHVSAEEFRLALEEFDAAEKALELKQDAAGDDEKEQKEDGKDKAVATGDAADKALGLVFILLCSGAVLTLSAVRRRR